MKFWLCLVCGLICNAARAQEAGPASADALRRDPTAPSAEILQRLAAAAPAVDALPSGPAPIVADEIIEVAPAFPELTLKGLVLADPDHGSALVEADGRRVTLRLSREPAGASNLPNSPASRLSGFRIQGIEFHVIDFNDRTLLLQALDRTVLVQ